MRAGTMAAVVLAACRAPVATPVAPAIVVPRLAAPPPIDLSVPGAGYLTAVAVQVQPGWGQFLDDCRLRLPAGDPLNQLSLNALAELAVDHAGRVTAVALARGSGNPDFDRAVRDAIADADAARLPPPPAELLSDDDQVHLRWLFARDRRQAGPATAAVFTVREPLLRVTERLLAAGDLARAARRVIAGGDDGDRAAAAERVMIAALRESIASADSAVRRAAIDAIARAHVVALAAEVRAQLAITNDADLRRAATAAVTTLHDLDATAPLLAGLVADLATDPALAVAETRALVELGRRDDAAAMLRTALATDRDHPRPAALAALAFAPVPELAPELARWFAHGDAGTRAAVCTALAGPRAASLPVAHATVLRGLADPDASVRASCGDTATKLAFHDDAVVRRMRGLLHDRDRTVRVHAIGALAMLALDVAAARAIADDPAPEVRVALVDALTVPTSNGAPGANLRRELVELLAADRDPEVRSLAIGVLAMRRGQVDRALIAHATTDPAAQVRRAIVPLLDDAALRQLAGDDSPEVRLAADVELAHRRGRDASIESSLARLAAAPPGSAERVRIALAWLLAA